jgi:membrane-associated phospholipid phosphatase
MIETLRHIDHQLFQFINQTLANPVLDVVCRILRSKNFLFLFYGLLALSVYRLYPKHFFVIVIGGALTFALTDQLSAHVIKIIFHRLRPCNNTEINARLLLVHCGSGFSFVSAHAANSFGMAAFISSLPKKRRSTILILGTWATLVSFSQVYVGVHFPADVIGGAILGVLVGLNVGLALQRIMAKHS